MSKVDLQERLHIFAIYFWHEALMNAVLKRVPRSNWIVACDGTLDPTDVARGKWVMQSRARGEAPPQGSATFCAKGTRGVEVRKRLHCLLVSESLEGIIVNVDLVTEDL